MLGEILYNARMHSGVSREKLGELTGINAQRIRVLESDEEYKNAYARQMERCADALGMEWVLRPKGESSPPPMEEPPIEPDSDGVTYNDIRGTLCSGYHASPGWPAARPALFDAAGNPVTAFNAAQYRKVIAILPYYGKLAIYLE